jgi:hypothetical protein
MAKDDFAAGSIPENEAGFWKSLASTMAPGWGVSDQSLEVQGGRILGGNELVIYLVDTTTGWTRAAGFLNDQVEHAIREADLRGFSENMHSLAISTIRDLADGGEGKAADPDLTKQALMASMIALGSTKLLATVRQQNGSIKGHYIYMIYQKQDGKQMARSFYADWTENGFIPLQKTFELSADAIRHDLQSKGYVGEDIRKGGGLVLFAPLKSLVG